jgi:hypothetical protein
VKATLAQINSLYQRIRDRFYEVLEISPPGDRLSQVINLTIIGLVILNAVAVGLDFISFFAPYQKYFYWFEVGSVVFFTLEYLLRLWSCTADSSISAVGGRIRYALRLLTLIDLIAILPFYLPMLFAVDLRILRLLRLARLARLFKISRYMRQSPPDESSVDNLINQFERHLAQIRQKLTAGRETDLEHIRQHVEDTISTIRQNQRALLIRSRRSRTESNLLEIAQQLRDPIDLLEETLDQQSSIRQANALNESAYAATTAISDEMPEWANLRVRIDWKNLESFCRIPMRPIVQHHFHHLADRAPSAFNDFQRIYLDQTQQVLDGVRTAMQYVVDSLEKAQENRSTPKTQEIQRSLGRAINRLRDLGERSRAAWDVLIWDLEEHHHNQADRVKIDLERYGSLMFYLGRLGRWLRRHAHNLLILTWDSARRFFHLAQLRFSGTYSSIYTYLRPTLEWIGLVRPEALKVMQTIDEARLNSIYERNLPEDYLAHFAFKPLQDEQLFIGLEEELTTIDRAIDRWENHLATSFIVHGQRGGGKTSLLNIARQRFFDNDDQVTQAVVERKVTTSADLVSYLSSILNLDGIGSLDELGKTLLAGPQQAILLEGCHNLFMRQIGGTEAIRHLFWLVARTNHHILWGLCMGKYAAEYFGKILPMNRLFHFEITIDEWTPEELRQLVMVRHNQSGYRLHYGYDKSLDKAIKRYVKRWRLPDEPQVQEALANIYFERLADYSGENIMAAFYYWLRSLEPSGQDRYTVRPLQELDLDLIHSFSLNQAFILNAILQHDNLSAIELSKILDTDMVDTRLELDILTKQSILDFDMGSSRFKINPVVLKPVAEMLTARNL